jgi:hypothetical protein
VRYQLSTSTPFSSLFCFRYFESPCHLICALNRPPRERPKASCSSRPPSRFLATHTLPSSFGSVPTNAAYRINFLLHFTQFPACNLVELQVLDIPCNPAQQSPTDERAPYPTIVPSRWSLGQGLVWRINPFLSVRQAGPRQLPRLLLLRPALELPLTGPEIAGLLAAVTIFRKQRPPLLPHLFLPEAVLDFLPIPRRQSEIAAHSLPAVIPTRGATVL